jgi:hypothetical protein
MGDLWLWDLKQGNTRTMSLGYQIQGAVVSPSIQTLDDSKAFVAVLPREGRRAVVHSLRDQTELHLDLDSVSRFIVEFKFVDIPALLYSCSSQTCIDLSGGFNVSGLNGEMVTRA